MLESHASRRSFLRLLPAVAVALVVARPARAADGGRPDHPEPRPGIDASRVLPREQLASQPDLARIFDQVREMPRICDGLACRCGCMDDPAVRSLLSCFEGAGMATHCAICLGQAEAAYRHFKRGRTLAEIRAALDADLG